MAHTFVGDEGFRTLVFGGVSPEVGNLFQQQQDTFNNYLSDRASDFMGFVDSTVNKIASMSFMQKQNALRHKAKHMFTEDIVHPFDTLDQMQQAKPVMRRWMMANPTLRRYFNKQRIAGYDEGYVDTQPGAIGDDHYDYRRATNGYVYLDQDDNWYATTWFEELQPGDRELDFDEQVDINFSWDLACDFLLQGKDPTSPTGDEL